MVYTLKCNITAEVNHLSEGLKIAMQEDREKNSTSLGRSALWKGESKATQLPPHLTVQFVRFFWKTNVSAADGTQGAHARSVPHNSYIRISSWVASRHALLSVSRLAFL